jgi:formylglycine-generating enzyme required for sulfatase activity
VGAIDLSGGAWEWVEDWASSPRQHGIDLRGPESGFFGIVRGGDLLNRSRVISRRDFVPHAGDVGFGFRLFKSID